MIKVRKADDLRRKVLEARRSGRTIGLVPTMGALHRGHASLVEMAAGSCDLTIVTIFVNPAQFGPGEDLEKYPRTIEDDTEMLNGLGCDLLFVPSTEDIYDSSGVTRIVIDGLGDHLCGGSRPGHFEGVMLVVAKLLNMASPDEAFFGQKDAQQAVILQRMAADLDFPVRIRIGPTIREDDGLAMSSRNAYLSATERRQAVSLREGLLEVLEVAGGGERSAESLKNRLRSRMEKGGFEVDYAEVVSAATLQPVDRLDGDILVAGAGRLGNTRLIDNMALRIEGGAVEEIVLEFPDWSRYDWR